MSRNIHLVVNKKGSKGSQALAKALKLRRMKVGSYAQFGQVFTPVINWGHSKAHFPIGLNKADAVNNAADKRLTFAKLKEANIPTVKWTVDKAEANLWFANGAIVVARTKVRAACGRGIVLCKQNHPEASSELVEAPLYTKYMNKDRELRIHVFQGKVIALAEKKRRRGVTRTLSQRLVQSHDNGWVFCTPDHIHTSTKLLAIKAIKALGLDFGAVDVIIRRGKAFILEVNTSPGLEGRTLTAYVEAMKGAIDEFNHTIANHSSGNNLQRRSSPDRSSNPG